MISSYLANSVCRIYMKNFLTYDEIEVHPKPHLNVIIGPNGTGKSSILCALCIGLGGKPALTGRGKTIGDYVKHDKDSAVTEVELHRDGEPNVVVRCSFSRRTTPAWHINGVEVTRKQVEKKMNELNIQVDNLCMFLPQDRVTDFARMNRIQLLENTEKSVVAEDEGPTLSEQHEILKDSGKKLSGIESRIESLSAELESEKRKNASIEDQVKNHDLKKEIEERIEQLRIRHTWYLYSNKRNEKLAAKTRRVELGKQFAIISQKMKPLENRMEKYRTESNTCRDKAKEHENKTKKHEPVIERICQRVEAEEDAIRQAEVELANCRQQEIQRKKEIKDMERHLSYIESEFAELEPIDESAMKKKLGELTEQIQHLSQDHNKLRQAVDEDRYQKEAFNRKANGYKKELEELEDFRRRRLEILRHQNQQVYAAAKWLQKNQDKFKGKVYDPMCTLINVIDTDYSKCVEDRISGQDMVAFVCEEKEDMNLFKRFMDQEKHRVSIVHAPHGNLSMFHPNTPIEELQRYGFEKYMSNVMTAPDAIMMYLCKNYGIHRIPLAKSGDFEKVPPSITLFYVGDSRCSKTQSRYDKQWSTSIAHVRQPRFLTITENTERRNEIIRELRELDMEIKQSDARMDSAHAQQKEVVLQMEKARDEKKKVLQEMDHRKQLEQRILRKRTQIENRKQNAINMEEKEADYKGKCKKHTLSAIGQVKEIHSVLRKATKDSEQSMQHAIKQGLFRERMYSLQNEVQHMSQEKDHLQDLVHREVARCKELHSEAESLLKSLCKAFNVTTPDNIPRAAREMIVNGQPNTVAGLEELISREEANRDCLIIADESVINEYNQREQSIEALTQELNNTKTRLTSQANSIEKSKKEWLPRIQGLTAKINERFSELFARLGCAGEVRLDKGENGNDFSKYGLLIQVKFRDTESLSELSSQHQSGGERAVATALFLLALQALTVVPFRCVDEINQGMDPTNERQMFSMLLETASARKASQYFVVTPKLLPNLEYNERVSYMIVYNSPNSLPQRRFSIQKVLGRLSKQKKRRKQT